MPYVVKEQFNISLRKVVWPQSKLQLLSSAASSISARNGLQGVEFGPVKGIDRVRKEVVGQQGTTSLTYPRVHLSHKDSLFHGIMHLSRTLPTGSEQGESSSAVFTNSMILNMTHFNTEFSLGNEGVEFPLAIRLCHLSSCWGGQMSMLLFLAMEACIPIVIPFQ